MRPLCKPCRDGITHALKLHKNALRTVTTRMHYEIREICIPQGHKSDGCSEQARISKHLMSKLNSYLDYTLQSSGFEWVNLEPSTDSLWRQRMLNEETPFYSFKPFTSAGQTSTGSRC